ncbi:MAG: DUF1499 domain-containing protein [Deltaproteobacteria bacterium]|nr:DUF1499 domain-containing protein [Deltaproteobacteria bacterium]
METALWGLGLVVVALAVGGVKSGRLAACPRSPNCVCSQDERQSHAVAPLRYEDDFESAMARLIEVIRSMHRTAIVRREGPYLHATFTTRIFRWVDDVEFLFDDAAKLLHVRSASREGWSDLGVNRRRVEEIRERFETDR